MTDINKDLYPGKPEGRRKKAIALVISVVLHGMLVFGLYHAKISIKIFPEPKKVRDVLITPPLKIVFSPEAASQLANPSGPETTGEEVPRSRSGRGRAVRPETQEATPFDILESPPAVSSGAEAPAPQPSVAPLLGRFSLRSDSSTTSTGPFSGLRINLSREPEKPDSRAATGAPARSSSLSGLLRYAVPGAAGISAGGRGPGGRGSRKASMSLAVRNYNILPWAEKAIARIQNNWNLPGESVATLSAQIMIFVRVEKDGSLSSSEVLSKTNQAALDGAALEALGKSTPFPALPDDFPETNLEAVIVFSYGR